MVQEMVDADFEWAAGLMARKRAEYRTYSPDLWNPADGIDAAHGEFLRSTAARPGSIALRTARAFLIGVPTDGRTYVDDGTVEEPSLWETEGRALLVAAGEVARSTDHPEMRVVTARLDEPKRNLLASLGLLVGARWWVKPLHPAGEVTSWGQVDLDGVPGLIMPAPPVYDPGGAVCLIGDVPADQAVIGAEAARRAGAVLAIVRRESNPVEHEPGLESTGFHNPSEFYDGHPSIEAGAA